MSLTLNREEYIELLKSRYKKKDSNSNKLHSRINVSILQTVYFNLVFINELGKNIELLFFN